MDNREVKFLSFNEDMIMEHLLAGEEHTRIAENTDNPGHISCLHKHLLLASNHSSEGISHSINNSYKTNLFTGIMTDISNFRNDLMVNGFNQAKALEKIRDIRKKAEQLNPAYNTNNCKACSRNLSSSYSNENQKDLYTYNLYRDYNIGEDADKNKIGGNQMADWKEFGVLSSGAFAGKFATWGTYELDKMLLGKDATTPEGKSLLVAQAAIYKRPSVWINVLGGLGLGVASMYLFKKKPSMKLFMASMGANMMTKSVDYLREAVGGSYAIGEGATPAYAAITPKMYVPAMPVNQRPFVPRMSRRIQVV